MFRRITETKWVGKGICIGSTLPQPYQHICISVMQARGCDAHLYHKIRGQILLEDKGIAFCFPSPTQQSIGNSSSKTGLRDSENI